MAQFPTFTADSFGFQGQGAGFGVEWRHFHPQLSLRPYAGETAGQSGLPLSGDRCPSTAQSPVPVSRVNPCDIPTVQSAVNSKAWGKGCGLIKIFSYSLLAVFYRDRMYVSQLLYQSIHT